VAPSTGEASEQPTPGAPSYGPESAPSGSSSAPEEPEWGAIDEAESEGRTALGVVGILDLVAAALLFAWFVAGGLYGADHGGSFGFNFGHEFNVAETDNFAFGSIGLFAITVLSAAAGILCRGRVGWVRQVGRGVTVALATFGLAHLVRFMQFQLTIHTRLGWGGFPQLVFLLALFALTFAGIIAAARPVGNALRTKGLEEGQLPWLAAFLGLTALLCVTLFFPVFHGALDPNSGERLGAYFTHHYLVGVFILVLYLFVPAVAVLSSDRVFEGSLLGTWSLCLVVDALAAVFTRDAFSSGKLTWSLTLRLAVSLALFALAVVRIITTPRAEWAGTEESAYYPEPSTSYTG
jgi:hypothetical protein